MASVHLNQTELAIVAKAHGTDGGGALLKEIAELCSKVTTTGRDSRDGEIVGDQDACQSLVTLITAMSRQTGFATSLLAYTDGDANRSHFVAALRYLMETLRNCSLLWWKNIIVGFAKYGLDGKNHDENCRLAESILEEYLARKAADDEIQNRLDSFQELHDIDDLALKIKNLEDLWTILHCCLHLNSASRSSGICIGGLELPKKSWQPDPRPTELCPPAIERFLLESPCIDPQEFASCRGAELALHSNGGVKEGRDGRPDVMANPTLMTQLLSLRHPMAPVLMKHDGIKEALLRLFLQHRCSLDTNVGVTSSDCRLLSMYCSSVDGVFEEEKWEHVCMLASSELVLGPAFDDRTRFYLRTLLKTNPTSSDCDLGPRLKVSFLPNGQAEPENFGSHGQWTRVYQSKIKVLLVATGLFRLEVRGSITHDERNGEVRSTDSLASVLDLFAEIPWFVSQSASSLHPMPNVRQHVITVLLEGMKRDPDRFKPYWKSVLGMGGGPPSVCKRGFQGNIFDSNCSSCRMPARLCPSILRLGSEVNKWAMEPTDASSRLHRAPAKNPSTRDLVRMVSRFQGTVPDKNNWATVPVLHEAANHFLKSKLVVVEGSGQVPWRFSTLSVDP